MVATVLAGAAGGALWLRRGEDLPRKAPEFSTILLPFSPTEPTFSVGLDIVDKGKDIEILEVKARTSPNVEYLGANAIWPRGIDVKHGQPAGIESGWPAGPHSRQPIEKVVPAAELEFEPKGFDGPGDLFVQVGFRLASGDLGGVNGLKLRYKVGGKTKSEYFSWGVIVCMKPHPCGGVGTEDRTQDDLDFYKQAYEQLGLVPEDTYKV